MDLAVAGRVEQHPIVRGVTAAMRPPDLVMVVPSCDRGDRFAAVWTAPILALPEVQQGPASLQRGRHLKPLPLLQEDPPLGIVGVDLTAAISGDFLSAVISIRYILGFRKDNPNVFNMLVQNLSHC